MLTFLASSLALCKCKNSKASFCLKSILTYLDSHRFDLPVTSFINETTTLFRVVSINAAGERCVLPKPLFDLSKMTFNRSVTCWKLEKDSDTVRLNVNIFLTFEISLCLMASLGNTAFLVVVAKSKILHSPFNILMGALSGADVISSYIVQPLYIAFCLLMSFKKVTKRKIFNGVNIGLMYSRGLSLLYITAMSMDRYAAICHPQIYHKKVSCKTHLAVSFACALIWSLLIIVFTGSSQEQLQSMMVVAFLLAFMVIVYTNIEILKEFFLDKRCSFSPRFHATSFTN